MLFFNQLTFILFHTPKIKTNRKKLDKNRNFFSFKQPSGNKKNRVNRVAHKAMWSGILDHPT